MIQATFLPTRNNQFNYVSIMKRLLLSSARVSTKALLSLLGEDLWEQTIFPKEIKSGGRNCQKHPKTTNRHRKVKTMTLKTQNPKYSKINNTLQWSLLVSSGLRIPRRRKPGSPLQAPPTLLTTSLSFAVSTMTSFLEPLRSVAVC